MISGTITGDSDLKRAFKSLGVVFGDIGTSPIYTLTVIFLILKPTEHNVISVLSLITWTLIIIVTGEYVWLAMSLSRRGEGGTAVLLALVLPYLKKGRTVSFVFLLAFLGISMIIGDGIITPSISILSAVEGMKFVSFYSDISTDTIVLISACIAVILLSSQKKGTERVSLIFAPLMLVWFVAILFFGVCYVARSPWILKAVNPWYAIDFLLNHGVLGFFTLSDVILCATGGEALYADMGHMKRKPITIAWCFVFISLLFNYMGQGAYLLAYPDSTNYIFKMVYDLTPFLYIPFLVVTILATVIASQAMISGIFSIIYQAINLHIFPMLKINFTSSKIKGQIYIGAVNWFLLIAILVILVLFRTSDSLAAAYGLAVTGAMSISGVLMSMIFYLRRMKVKFIFSLLVTVTALTYFFSCTFKIDHGGYWSIILSMIPLLLILIYTQGEKRLYAKMCPSPIEDFIPAFFTQYNSLPKLHGTALYLVRDGMNIPLFVEHSMIRNQIIYEDNIIVQIKRKEGPWGSSFGFKPDFTKGLRLFEINVGYMEKMNLEAIFIEAGIQKRAIFYGIEDIETDSIIWQTYALIKKIFPRTVKYYNLPVSELHGIIIRVTL
ncbi:MAG TPA: potassium transporter Kup [Lentisphaeria bacterium]|nr:MAG: potassium transporter Kup [Lentisphaerae bacterium GWF2_38_69]HBM14789.1 potassium transporter Kup [Lentisphaeria bacterium]